MVFGVPLIVIMPHRTLRNAVPAAAVFSQRRNQILAGNDVNLVEILVCSADSSGRHLVDCGDVSVILKRVTPDCQNLTMAEFNVAGVHRDVICEAYPARRVELDPDL